MSTSGIVMVGAATLGKVEDPLSLPGGIQLQIYTHNIFEDGERVITVAMIKVNPAGNNALEKAKECAFQPELIISGDIDFPFANVNRCSEMSTDDELLELEMLYSDVSCYGQGHGCSVLWDMENDEPKWISAAWFPEYNLHFCSS